jgi:hypothetical protein
MRIRRVSRIDLNIQPAFFPDGIELLGDLEAFGQVSIEIILSVKTHQGINGQVKGHAGL